MCATELWPTPMRRFTVNEQNLFIFPERYSVTISNQQDNTRLFFPGTSDDDIVAYPTDVFYRRA